MEGHKKLHLIVMAGGSGTRFWPRSRVHKPKQLLALWDERTLIEHTLDRFKGLVNDENTWIVTTAALESATRAILDQKHPQLHYLLEPSARNTAPCILWGILEIQKRDPDALIAVMPADHFIGNEKAFRESIEKAVACAEKDGGLVTLGVKPDRPETGFGYIETEAIADLKAPRAMLVNKFVEKPDLRTALRYVESGRYLWNAGMFIFRASVGHQAFLKCMPSLTTTFEVHHGNITKIYDAISASDATSIDFGVMEGAASRGIHVRVLPVDCGWNDVGSFTALEDLPHRQASATVSLDAACNIVQTDRGIVALLGVNDVVVVRDGDVVLVCAKDRAQDVKPLLEKVRTKFPQEL